MKPDKIIIVRHGESQGNVDKKIYQKVPDYALDLTEKGRNQAFEAGQKISKLINGPAAFYVSPYWRTRRTAQYIAKSVQPFGDFYEDPRLREQEWSGQLRDYENFNYDEVERERDNYGRFYFRIDGGESCADVYDRVSDFLNTLHRDFEKENFPKNVVIPTHGLAMRVLLMRWFHYSVEKFELLANPKNCEFWVLQKNESDHYDLIGEPRVYENHTHAYQYDWSKI